MKDQLISAPNPFGFRFLRKKAGVNPLIVNYHMVSDSDLPYIQELYSYRDVKSFIRDLEFFQKNYTAVGLKDFLASIRGDSNLPDNALLLTFDDGFREIYDIAAPLLLEKGIPATFFITRDFVDNKQLNHDNKQSILVTNLKDGVSASVTQRIMELADTHNLVGADVAEIVLKIPYVKRHLLDRIGAIMDIDFAEFLKEHTPYVTTKQIKDLINQGFTIGAHSLDHARFSELPMEEQLFQVRSSLEYLETAFSLDYRVFAFPYSDFGVSTECFKKISRETDASFGTHGLMEDPVINHIQRISVEKYKQSASKTIKFHYLKRIVKNMSRKNLILRQ